MFKWLSDTLGLRKFWLLKPIVNQRSTKNGESITKDEGQFIAYCVKNNLPPCPDCEKGSLLKGPEGCGSINCLFNNCLSEFSIYWISESYVIGERISDPRDCKDQRVRAIYGIDPKLHVCSPQMN